MQLQHLIAKIPVSGSLGIDPARTVDLFHTWVAGQTIPGVLLVDVAELLHVPDGPGVIAVGHEADYALDHTDGIWGALHRRKALLEGSDAQRVSLAIAGAALVASRIEAAFPGAVAFSRNELELIVNDRGIAPNTPATHAQALPLFEASLREALGHAEFALGLKDPDPRQRYALRVQSRREFELKS